MTEKAKKYLYDIYRSANGIDEYLEGKRDFEQFREKKIVRRAIEREFEIIGEAVNRLTKLDDAIKLNNARRIVGLRNFIIHAYDEVDEKILWGIILNNLPELKEEIESLLNQ